MDVGKTLIVGGGIAGLATAWGLARAGVGPICLLERETHLGFWSSGRNAGILRTAIHAPATRKLALESAALFESLPNDLQRYAGGPILEPVGLVLSEGAEGLADPLWLQDLQERDAVFPMTPESLAQKIPHYRPEGTRAWWLPRSGRILVGNLMQALETACRAMGVEFRTGCEVTNLVRDQQGQVYGAALRSGEALEADRILLAPGAWVQPLARALGLDFPARTTRRHLFFALPQTNWHPDDPIVWDDAAGFYFLGTGTGEMLLSLCDGDDAHPDRLIIDPLLQRLIQRRVASSLPDLGSFDWKRGLVGIRTISEDDVPVIAKHPGQDSLFWVAALGGHGITLSLGMAELTAKIVMGEPIDPNLTAALGLENAERAYQPTRPYSPL